MDKPMILGEPEVSYLRRFFDAVDKGVTREMQAGASLLEESLTFVLARLLDGKSTFQRMLDYPLEKLNADLEACGSGTGLTIEFETNEHKKSFESAISYADLGIVIHWEASVLHPAYTKALIVQSKKLYQVNGAYTIRSGYDGFDRGQFNNLRALASKYDGGGIYYFLYNPALNAFPEEEAKVIQAIEARLYPGMGWAHGRFPFWDPEMEYIFHRFLREYPVSFAHTGASVDAVEPDRLRDERSAALQTRPGLRVLGLASVAALAESNKTVRKSFRLEECYRYAFSAHWWQSSGAVPFLPLSSFVVDMVLGCSRGTTNENIIRIAEGREPDGKPPADSPGEAPGLAVRHTLKITVRNTLPLMDVHFRE